MRQALVAITAALLAGCVTTPSAVDRTSPVSNISPIFTAEPLSATIPSDLPRIARPLQYEIAIEPDAANLTFAANSKVRLEVYEATDRLVLHSHELDFDEASLLSADGSLITALEVTGHDPKVQTVEFAAPASIAPGTYILATKYTGKINTQAVGLFALDYPDKRTGEDVRSLFTQFEAPDARRLAPMFDEPSYKATFDLSVIVPASQMAVGNMPAISETDLGNGRKQVVFGTSPKMSSYLLFFATGDFERSTMVAPTGTEVGIVAPTGSGDQARFALEGLAPLMPWFEDYFGLAYPLPKLDNIAAPGQSQFFGAMENWGAILTFESLLLDDPQITSPARRQQIYTTQVHEVAHQWFGNIVTMGWWDDLWLNEGFASWLDTKVTHELHPEWQQNLVRVGVRERAMGLDAYANTHPVVQDISTVAELAQAFDGITYAKGEAVISMFEAYAGEAVWREGLQTYLDRHAYANTASTDLWRAMEEAGATGLTAIADDFTNQPGVPLVMAMDECVDGQTQLMLTQSEFTRDRRNDPQFLAQSWHIPLNIAVAGQKPVKHVLSGSAELTLPGCGAVIVNAGQQGYFRTSYMDDMALGHVTAFADFTPIDQLGLLRDSFSLSAADYKPIDPAMALLEAVPGDANPIVADFAVEAWADAFLTLDSEREAERAAIAAIATRNWGPRLAQLGFDPIVGEPVVDINLRATLIAALGTMGDERVAAEARERFAALASDPRAMDGPLKTTWLNIASRNATPAEWDLLAQLADQSTSTAERQIYYRRLGAARDEMLASQALDFALTGKAGTASAAIITQVSNRFPELAFEFVMEHRDAVRAMVDDSGWQGYIAGLAGGSDDPQLLEQLEQLRDAMPADEAVPLTRAIDAFRLRLETQPRQEQALLDWLAKRGE